MKTKIFVFNPFTMQPMCQRPQFSRCNDNALEDIKRQLERMNSRLDELEDILNDDFESDLCDDDFINDISEPTPPPMKFGAAFEIDEPMAQDYSSKTKFLEARRAFDNFVDAGEQCVELGLDKRNDAPITKCNAIRKRVGDNPPIGVDLIGETNWWEDDSYNCKNWWE